MNYDVFVIESKAASNLLIKIKDWLSKAPEHYKNFCLISINHVADPIDGCKALIVFKTDKDC
ncbi:MULTISPECIES: hypothetical protein [unclassified Acinetobacter]|uniref:hypothetical protein n=1 Tax=unclassified Acinetobacter TaxID=196816 RepID=UPI00257909E8|nr:MULTISPECIES: hypothetical protein [unclassified Acinetobacter]MDM1766012.1 hypothetical protein [Acinetobacter sp. 226-1]MDM1769765.1 hypothetical protein [Acinetobacter sp. 226-4]